MKKLDNVLNSNNFIEIIFSMEIFGNGSIYLILILK